MHNVECTKIKYFCPGSHPLSNLTTKKCLHCIGRSCAKPDGTMKGCKCLKSYKGYFIKWQLVQFTSNTEYQKATPIVHFQKSSSLPPLKIPIQSLHLLIGNFISFIFITLPMVQLCNCQSLRRGQFYFQIGLEESVVPEVEEIYSPKQAVPSHCELQSKNYYLWEMKWIYKMKQF